MVAAMLRLLPRVAAVAALFFAAAIVYSADGCLAAYDAIFAV